MVGVGVRREGHLARVRVRVRVTAWVGGRVEWPEGGHLEHGGDIGEI